MKAVILAGGNGTRLWPFSKKSYPKQFLKFDGKYSLLQNTAKRLLYKLQPQDIITMTNVLHEKKVKKQLSFLSSELTQNIILEPEQRNTAPAIALAVKYIIDELGCNEDEAIFVGSSDHIIAPEKSFTDYLNKAEIAAQQGNIITFGVIPNKPETGYGYIKKGNDLGGSYNVEQFVEKPDLDTAQKYLISGEFLWNSGMFAFTAKTMLDELSNYAPDIMTLLKSYQNAFANFSKMPNVSIDYAIMEKSKRVAVLPLDLTWSDIGSWDGLYSLLEKDENDNVLRGNVCPIETQKTFVWGQEKLIATIGLRDIVIIDTPKAILIAKSGSTQHVRDVIKKLKEQNQTDLI